MALLTVCLVALVAAASASEPLPSLKHDTDVVRLARPNPRLFLVDVIRPPVPPADPVQTNEVGVDDELPRLVRVLVPAPELPLPDEDYQPRPAPPHEDRDASSEGLTRLQPPAADQPAPAAEWDSSSPQEAASAVAHAVAAPAEELQPPAAGQQPDEWTKHQQTAGPRVGDVKEPSSDIQPPSVGLWELFEELKKIRAVADAVEAKEPLTELAPPVAEQPDFWTQQPAESRADHGDEAEEMPAVPAAPAVPEPALELVPPPPGQPDLSDWAQGSAQGVPLAAAATAKLLHTKDQALADAPEPATFLVPPMRDSYTPEKPSSGEAGPDDFLSLGTAPKESATSTYDQVQADSYLPESGELAALREGPVADDFLAIGEAPKVTDPERDSYMPDEASKDVVVKDSYMPDGTVTAAMSERDSYMPEQKSAVNSTEKDSYMPDEKTSPAAPSAATPSEADATSIEGLTPPKGSQEATSEERTDAIVHEHGAGHVHDEVHATTPRSTEGDDDEEEEDEDEEEVDGDGVVPRRRRRRWLLRRVRSAPAPAHLPARLPDRVQRSARVQTSARARVPDAARVQLV